MSKIVFRVDSSAIIGTGHVMRCLTLADALSTRENYIVFFCRSLPGNMIQYIKDRGYHVQTLKGDCQTINLDQKADARQVSLWLQHNGGFADWLVVDHYGIDAEWERCFRAHTGGILAIDDLADRKHDCDILLDQNYYFCMEDRYAGLLPSSCRKLFGPEYSMLRSEFIMARRQIEPRSGSVKRMLVFFGGSDPTGETLKTLRVLNHLKVDISIDVVVGQSNPKREEIKHMCHQLGYHYHCQIHNMAELMARADLSVGAGGSTIWERCFLGLPTLVIEVAENQHEVITAVASTGAILNMGRAKEVTESDLAYILQQCLDHPEKLQIMSGNALKIMGDPLYIGTDKILKIMEEFRAGA